MPSCHDEERLILERTTGDVAASAEPVLDGAALLELQQTARRVPVPTHVTDFVLDIVRSARPASPEAAATAKAHLEWGPGPRAGQSLLLAAKVRALLDHRYHATAGDVAEVALPTLRHRLVPTFGAEAEGVTVADIVASLVDGARAKLPRKAI